MEDWLVDALMELYRVIKSGYASQTTAVVEQITGQKPISFEQFARDYAKFFQMKCGYCEAKRCYT